MLYFSYIKERMNLYFKQKKCLYCYKCVLPFNALMILLPQLSEIDCKQPSTLSEELEGKNPDPSARQVTAFPLDFMIYT